MDNVTHTVAGLLAAEAALALYGVVQRKRGERGATPDKATATRFARVAYWVSALANNLPDTDFVYSGITQPSALGYLMHHRGHTHTLSVACVMVAVLMLAFRAIAKRFFPTLLQLDWRWLWGLALLGPVLHMAMDFTNNYGVHPFWPLYNGWLYGDSVFIIEPLYLLTGLPLLFFAMRSGVARAFFVLLALAVLGLAWWAPFVPVSVAVGLTIFVTLACVAAARLSAARRIIVGGAMFVAIPLVFSVARAQADAVVRSALPADAQVVDVVLTPSPSNPLCWSTWALYLQSDQYVADSGRLTLAPSLFARSDCEGPFHAGATTAELQRVNEAVIPQTRGERSRTVQFSRQYRAPLSELKSLAGDCYAAAYLRYSRL
ncbi:MAG TPA: metal-dependent hydrolase, partial [Polyangiaceae bacterium]|nr:metal-dependent hydrolase [Polyangiaceae bacterium]